MSQTGTPTEFLQLGITEPDDTLNVLVDLNGQWRKIDTGVKNVDTKANTNASGISALNTAVQDNTENITNILETNVNQQTSIDTLQAKVATLEEDDTSYGTRITAVEAGVQENSELINDLEVDLSGVKTSVGTVPSGSNLQGEVNGLDTRVTALENSGSVAAVEARVTTLETEVGTVPAGETVQGQITTLNGQVNSGNIPFRFSVDGGGNYGYLKADDSFAPFRSGDSHWHKLDTNLYSVFGGLYNHSFILNYVNYTTVDTPNYGKLHDMLHDIDYTLPNPSSVQCVGCVILVPNTNTAYLAKHGNLLNISGTVAFVKYNNYRKYTHLLTRNNNAFQYKVLDENGDDVGLTVNHTISGTPTSPIYFNYYSDDSDALLLYTYNNALHKSYLNIEKGTGGDSTITSQESERLYEYVNNNSVKQVYYSYTNNDYDIINNVVYSAPQSGSFFVNVKDEYWYYL